MKKQAITIIASKETYENLSRFENIEDLNRTVREYKDRFADQLNKNQLAVLEHLHNYSAKFFGVSFRTKNNIAKTLGISRRTVIRACQHLESLGIIKQLEMKRKSDMRQTSNAIVIQPVEEQKEQVVTQENKKISENCHTNKTTSKSLKTNNLNKRKRVSSADRSVDKSKANFVAHWVPERFVSLVSYFYRDAKTIEEFWRVVKQLNRVVNFSTNERAFDPQQELTIASNAFKAMIMKMKEGVKVKNIFGYFNRIVDNLMDKLYFDEDFMGR